jgi:thioester reductase-like protein
MAEGFTVAAAAVRTIAKNLEKLDGMHIVVTGATGSLGSHVIANLALHADVTKVVCLNRHGKLDARLRRWRAFADKGIQLPERTIVKLRVTSTDLSEPNLGLTISQHKYLVDTTTHIVQNACLMNAKWPAKKFELQLKIMRNLLDLASSVAGSRTREERVVRLK